MDEIRNISQITETTTTGPVKSHVAIDLETIATKTDRDFIFSHHIKIFHSFQKEKFLIIEAVILNTENR